MRWRKDRSGSGGRWTRRSPGLSATQQQLGVSRASRQQVRRRWRATRGLRRRSAGVVTWRYADTGSLIQAGTSNAASMHRW